MADETVNMMIKGAVVQNDYQSKFFPLIINEAQGLTDSNKVNYINGDPFNSTPTPPATTTTSTPAKSDNEWVIDIAQSHHFTIEIKDAPNHKSLSGNLLSYRAPDNTYSNFLPVKNMSLSYSGFENMSIPLSIFGDFQLMQRKRLEMISLSCYDEDTHTLEHNLQLWNEECFPQGKYVAYMDEVVKELIYRGYTVDGRESLNVRRFVILSGPIQVSRDYEENGAKIINFSLACVGDGSTCATGAPAVFSGEGGSGGSGGAAVGVVETSAENVKSARITAKTKPSNIPKEGTLYLDNNGNLSKKQTWDSSREEEAVKSVSSGVLSKIVNANPKSMAKSMYNGAKNVVKNINWRKTLFYHN